MQRPDKFCCALRIAIWQDDVIRRVELNPPQADSFSKQK